MARCRVRIGRAVKGGPTGPTKIRYTSTVARTRSRSTQRRIRSIRSSPRFRSSRLESRYPHSRFCSTEWRAASTLVAEQSFRNSHWPDIRVGPRPSREPDDIGVEVDAVGAAEPDAGPMTTHGGPRSPVIAVLVGMVLGL